MSGERSPKMTRKMLDRLKYRSLREAGAGHEVATRRTAMGNWNPYTESEPVPTPQRLTEVESNVADMHR